MDTKSRSQYEILKSSKFIVATQNIKCRKIQRDGHTKKENLLYQ